MSKWFLIYNSDDIGFAMSDSLGLSFDGDMLMRICDNVVMNMDTGDLELISGWPDYDSHGNSFDDEE